MEMTRDELNKMTIRGFKVHLKQHGKRPNRQSMIKGHIIDLIIQEGFNRPPPEMPKEEVTNTEPQVIPKHWDIKARVTIFTGEEIRGCKTNADLDDLINTKLETVQYMGEGELNQLD